MNLLMSLIGLIGTCNESPRYIRTYALWLLLNAMLSVLIMFMGFPNIPVQCEAAWENTISQVNNPEIPHGEFVDMCNQAMNTTMYLQAFWSVAIGVYFAVCAHSYYLDLLELPLTAGFGYTAMPNHQPAYNPYPAQVVSTTPSIVGYADVSSGHA